MHGKYYVDSQRIIFIRYEMPTVLRMRGFLACKLSFRLLCQNRCTVRREQMPHKACKGHWEFRYNYNFIWQPAQIHIHVQLHLAGTSLYQRCPLPDEIPSAPNRHLYFDEPYSDSDKHWKDCFYNQKKTPHFRTVVFRSERKSTANQRNIIVATLLNPSFTIAWNIYGRNRIKKYIFYKDYTNIRQSKS